MSNCAARIIKAAWVSNANKGKQTIKQDGTPLTHFSPTSPRETPRGASGTQVSKAACEATDSVNSCYHNSGPKKSKPKTQHMPFMPPVPQLQQTLRGCWKILQNTHTFTYRKKLYKGSCSKIFFIWPQLLL